ncbi:uncharacterized protein LOC117319256 [Pecten maximus]|uniref:uncharacterized protein LOC117319256 n=1 Tax=Pecten maximus TaxID=6579 RepID=UPI001459105C|nr:uncharacterized protein LOC117319256 [Pecten maximus]
MEESTVTDLIQQEIKKGFLSGPFQIPPFKQYRVSPIGLATGKYSGKKRLIVDLSAPHEDENNPSVNELINKEECSLSYVRIEDAIDIIKKIGPGAVMCKTDISDAFKLIPIQPSQWHLFCVKWDNQYYYYKRLAFGCRSSPKIFDNLSLAICWIASENYKVRNILHLLDDFITINSPKVDGKLTMDTLLHIFETLEIPLASHKTEGPCCEVEYLGIVLDSVKMEARLPVVKLERLLQMLKEFDGRKSLTKLELLQLLGHLNFASRVVPVGKSFISYLITLSTTVTSMRHHVRLNFDCREDIHMWIYFLIHWNGISLFRDSNISQAADMELYTDASATLGFGGYFQGKWFSSEWPVNLQLHGKQSKKASSVSIAYRELYPIVVACILWGRYWERKQVLFWCDNIATVDIINKGRSKALNMMPLMRKLTLCAAQNNFTV